MHRLFFLGLFLVLGVPAFAAPPSAASKSAAVTEDGWIKPPSNFLMSRMVRAVDAPAKTYDVIVDVPPTASGKTAKPKIAQSCGDPDIDRIGSDYVKTILRQKSGLSAQNQRKELRFQLRLSPVPMKAPATPIQTAHDTIYKGFHLSTPAYPENVRMARGQGSGRLRVSFAHGRVEQVIVTESTGNIILDANTAVFALANWTAPKDAPPTTLPIPVTYRLTRGPHEKGSMRTLSTDDQIFSF